MDLQHHQARHARAEVEGVRSPDCVRSLVGTIGADPVHRPMYGRARAAESPTAAMSL